MPVNVDLQSLREPVSSLIREACSTLVLPRFRALEQKDIKAKSSPRDLVTVADIETEEWLTPRLADLVPGSIILGEEAQSRGEVDLDVMQGTSPVWVLDPVDGTYNFVHGKEEFCCMVALVQEGQVLAGWIYFPTEGRLYWAGRGLGAHVGQEGENSRPLVLENPALLATISSRIFQNEPLKSRKKEILAALSPTAVTGCAGDHYRRAAEGRLAYVVMKKLMPWDHAAGTLLVQEAGGEARLNREQYDPRQLDGILICGRHGPRMAEAEAQLFDV